MREILAGEPVLAKDAQEEARGAGISDRTLKRARSSLGVVAERKGEPRQQGGGRWYWRLPEVKGATPKGWHSKPEVDRNDEENVAYIRQDGDAGLSGPNANGIKGATEAGLLNRPLSADLSPGESATLEELRRRRAASGGQATTNGSRTRPADVRALLSKPPAGCRTRWTTAGSLALPKDSLRRLPRRWQRRCTATPRKPLRFCPRSKPL